MRKGVDRLVDLENRWGKHQETMREVRLVFRKKEKVCEEASGRGTCASTGKEETSRVEMVVEGVLRMVSIWVSSRVARGADPLRWSRMAGFGQV